MDLPKEIYLEITKYLSDIDKAHLVQCSTELNTLKYFMTYDTLVHNEKITNLPFYDNFTNIIISSFKPKILDSGPMIIQTVDGSMKFNGILYGIQLPRCVQKLTINCKYNDGIVIPKSVTHLTFGDIYRGNINDLVIPDTVKIINLPKYYHLK